MEKQDKRLFDYAERETLLSMQPENWGTYHLGIHFSRQLISSKRLSVLLGSGISIERATFTRPFDHSHFQQDSLRILRVLNRYDKVQLPVFLMALYPIGDYFIISGEITADILIHRAINHTEGDSRFFPYTENTLELDDAHLALGINYRVKNFIFGMKARVMNLQRIDRIIFNYHLDYPEYGWAWEWHNPLRFDFSVGYFW